MKDTSSIEGGNALDVQDLISSGPLRAIFLCFITCAVRLAAYRERITVGLVIRRFIVAIGLGYLAYEIFASIDISEPLRYSLLIFIALWADDILIYLMDLGRKIRKNPIAILSVFKKIFGKN